MLRTSYGTVEADDQAAGYARSSAS